MRYSKSLYILFALSIFASACKKQDYFIPTLNIQPVYKAEGLFNQVYFTDALHGFAIGDEGVFVKTADGGKTWNQIAIPEPNSDFNNISFPSKLIGYVSGEPSIIMKTTDGGENWFQIAETKWYGYVHFPTTNVGYAIDYYNADVYKTTNGGTSWTQTTFSYNTGIYEPDRLFFFSEDTGIVIENYYGEISFTYNGGNTWSNSYESDYLGRSKFIRKFNNLSFWASNGMFYSNTHGSYYERFNSDGFTDNNYNYIRSINSYDGNNFSACGNFLFTGSNDGGFTWTEYFDPTGRNFEMIDAAYVNDSVFVGINDTTIYRLTAF